MTLMGNCVTVNLVIATAQSDFRLALRAVIIITSEREKMSEKENREKSQVQILRDAFEGMKGRQPNSDQ
ncbi:hypothetical protein [Rhodoblastus sp.]|uniref:hypothetical protein n=1 Tax=Rhodoblastus sp. TaxID=1962975 RepID=UPI003F98C7E1